ncbi:MAG: response regulator transcription factor [Flavipsychrobacter sp.]|nr:response regulator transcription factor [Flavipsychrobacter sp.]
MNANSRGLQQLIIIEDDLAIKTLLCTVLEYNFVVTAFENGMDALAYMQKGNIPDIIISDLNTPELNGYELLIQLKASNLFKSIPVIILSGEEGSETRIKCLEGGADDYIVKPFNPRELEVRINVILKRYGKSLITKHF